MSGQFDREKSTNGGEEKQGKGKKIALGVGAAATTVHGKNVSMHAEDNEFWMTSAVRTGNRSCLGSTTFPTARRKRRRIWI